MGDRFLWLASTLVRGISVVKYVADTWLPLFPRARRGSTAGPRRVFQIL